VLEDKIASKANLVKRGILVENNICSMCEEEEETASHVFLYVQGSLAGVAKCFE